MKEQQIRNFLILLGICPDCGEEIIHDIVEPFASCACGAMEWTSKLPLLSAELIDKQDILEILKLSKRY